MTVEEPSDEIEAEGDGTSDMGAYSGCSAKDTVREVQLESTPFFWRIEKSCDMILETARAAIEASFDDDDEEEEEKGAMAKGDMAGKERA